MFGMVTRRQGFRICISGTSRSPFGEMTGCRQKAMVITTPPRAKAMALAAAAPILAADVDTVCVIHGGVIACLMHHWFPGKAVNDWMIQPGTGWQITVEDGKPVSYVPVPFVPV